ncbi:MAG: hypothetical protein JXR84_13070 [Anaerolineae bacterium]|nr:hypothetical protein [Anaerolineae bacterium]
MALSWSEKQSVIALVGEELARRGWQLFGYREDQSDIMTDYYCPASWDGIATHPDYPGVVVGVGVSDYQVRRSGTEEIAERHLPDAECPHCGGSGVDPSGWTLEAARREPARYHRERIAAEHGPNSGVVALMNTVVSPIPFHDDGRLKCVKCAGRGHTLRREAYVRWTWPEFQVTPRGRMWHVEREGHIVKSGTGYTQCREGRWNEAGKRAVRAVCDAIEAAARQTPAASPAETVTGDVGEFTITHERDWTWIQFPEKPGEGVRTTLKGMGARWSKRRSAWYIRQHIEVPAVQAALMG